MAPSLFGGNSVDVAKYFEIRLERSVIILRGGPDEAASSLLRGTLVMCLADQLGIKRISLRLRGSSRIGSPDRDPLGAVRPRVLREESTFFNREVVFLQSSKARNEMVTAGNYEFPFEIIIPGSSPESVEGLGDSWIIYRVKATVDRGFLSSKLQTRKHMRVVRTLEPSSLELVHEMSIENVWDAKARYALKTPSKAFIFGTSIPVQLTMVPLLKGLRLGEIQMTLSEAQDYRHQDKNIRFGREVTRLSFQVDEALRVLDDQGQEGWLIERNMTLPTSLARCLQDVDALGIKVRHRLLLVIQLLNPDGHSSEIRAILPVRIFISPTLMVNERNQLIEVRPTDAMISQARESHAPPLYGHHRLDQLWREIDPAGYMTPANAISGANTPLPSPSRNASSENLTLADVVSPSLPSSSPNAIPPHLLRTRLDHLPDDAALAPDHAATSSGNGTIPEAPSTGPAPTDQVALSHPTSREARAESPVQMTEHIEYDTGVLSKVPSYRTAVEAPAGTPLSGDLPDYEAATRCNFFRPTPSRLRPRSPISAPDSPIALLHRRR